METKPWYASKTLWVIFIAFVVAVPVAFGLDLGVDPETQAAIVTAVLALVNIVLRFITTTAIKTETPNA